MDVSAVFEGSREVMFADLIGVADPISYQSTTLRMGRTTIEIIGLALLVELLKTITTRVESFTQFVVCYFVS